MSEMKDAQMGSLRLHGGGFFPIGYHAFKLDLSLICKALRLVSHISHKWSHKLKDSLRNQTIKLYPF